MELHLSYIVPVLSLRPRSLPRLLPFPLIRGFIWLVLRATWKCHCFRGAQTEIYDSLFNVFVRWKKCMGECKRLSSVRKVSSSSSSLRLNRWKAVESSEKRAERVGNWVEKGNCLPRAQVHISCIFMARALSSELCCRPISQPHWHVARWAMSPTWSLTCQLNGGVQSFGRQEVERDISLRMYISCWAL